MIAIRMKKLLLTFGLMASVATLAAQQPIQDGTGRNFVMVALLGVVAWLGLSLMRGSWRRVLS